MTSEIDDDQIKEIGDVRFAVLLLMSCNGAQSVSFSNAKCDFGIYNDHEPSYVSFEQIFVDGISFLKNRTQNEKMLNARTHLDNFFKKQEDNGKALRKVFDLDGTHPLTETDVTIALTEHLLKELSPGISCKIDSRSKHKRPCRCGCKKKANYDNTKIGNKLLWHGLIDIMLSLPEATTTQKKSSPENENEKNGTSDTIPTSSEVDDLAERLNALKTKEDNRPVGELIAEVKLHFSEYSMNQAIAQTIVFSCIQKKKYPTFPNHMVPNIVISPENFRVIMYDAEKDVLLCSKSIDLFNPEESETLSKKAVVVLWMILHYRLFCSGMKNVKERLLQECKSTFPKCVHEKWNIYSEFPDDLDSRYKKYKNIDDFLDKGKKLELFDST